MVTRPTHALDPWRLRAKFSALSLSCFAAESRWFAIVANPAVACDGPCFARRVPDLHDPNRLQHIA